MAPKTGLATISLLVATAVWGATFVTVKDALARVDTFSFLAVRFAIGAAAAGLLATLTGPRSQWNGVAKPGLVLGGLLFGGYLFQTLGLESTSPARSAFVTGLTVLFVPFVSWRLDRRRPPVRAFLAPVVALVGLQRLTGVSWGEAVPQGDVLTLGCAVLYAFHIAAMGRYAKGLAPLALTSAQLAVVSVLSTACLPFVARRFDATPAVWLSLAFTGIGASALAIGGQAWAQRHLSAVRAAVIYSLEPVFTLASMAVLGQGWPTSNELTGGVLIVFAVLVSEVDLSAFRRSPSREGTHGAGL